MCGICGGVEFRQGRREDERREVLAAMTGTMACAGRTTRACSSTPTPRSGTGGWR
jgi:hypothetical protein